MSRPQSYEHQEGIALLDEAHALLNDTQSIWAGMDLLFSGLSHYRNQVHHDEWQEFCEDVCVTHPVRALVHQDPVTYRSYSKPKGYAGDAHLLDFLYRHTRVLEEKGKATPLGQVICDYTTSRPSSSSVRWRKVHLAQSIDETAFKISSPEVLSVACGHLREAHLSQAVQTGSIKRLVAFDQDEDSLKLVEAEKNGRNIECVAGSVKDLLRRRTNLGTFDLIYSAGLYDYLPEGTGHLLSKALFRMLNDGGRLIIANFVPNEDMGYMEAFMGWKLLHRTRQEFERLVESLEPYLQKLYFDDNRCVVYIELQKW